MSSPDCIDLEERRSTLPRTSSLRLRHAAVVMALMLAGVGCGSTSGPSSNTTTTTAANTTSTTTTSVQGLGGSFTVQNLPCNAAATGPVSCTFVASGSGGNGTYAFTWAFFNPASNVTVPASGQSVKPDLGCGFSVGAATIAATVTLTVESNGTRVTLPSVVQQIVRVAGNCGV